MTEENNQPTEGSKEPTTPATPTPEPPKIDIDAIAAQVAKQASESLSGEREKLTKDAAREIARRLDPDHDNKNTQVHPLLAELIKDPEGFVSTLSQVTRESTTKEITEARNQERADNKKLTEMSEEYPEVVGENLDLVDAMFSRVQAEDAFKGKSRNEVIEEAVRRTAKRLRIKPMSERSSEDSFRNSVFPGVGSSSASGNSTSADDSAFNYIKGRREAMQKLKRGG